MSEPADHGPYAVPLEALAGSRANGRRAGMVAIAILTIVGSAIGLARLSDGGPAGPARSAAAAGRSPDPRGVESMAPAATGIGRVEQLIGAPDRPLVGAPEVTLSERAGPDLGDLRIRSWATGHGLTTVRIIPRALAGLATEPIFPVLSPDRRRVLVLVLNTDVGVAADRARLVDSDGAVLWTGDGIAAASGALWSADGRLVVTAGQPRRWHLVSIGPSGRALDRVVSLPGDVFLPNPTPIGSISLPDIEARTVPVGFSADGRWIYGGVISPQLGLLIGEFRVSLDGIRVERVLDFRVGQRDGLVPQPGTLGTRTVDPLTGRTATRRVGGDTSGYPGTVEVRNPDAGFAFLVPSVATLGVEWGSDGGLYALTADSPVLPSWTRLVRVGRDGVSGQPILETGPVARSFLVGVRDRFAAIATFVTRPAVSGQVLLVDVDDPTRIAAVGLPVDAADPLIAAGLDP